MAKKKKPEDMTVEEILQDLAEINKKTGEGMFIGVSELTEEEYLTSLLRKMSDDGELPDDIVSFTQGFRAGTQWAVHVRG